MFTRFSILNLQVFFFLGKRSVNAVKDRYIIMLHPIPFDDLTTLCVVAVTHWSAVSATSRSSPACWRSRCASESRVAGARWRPSHRKVLTSLANWYRWHVLSVHKCMPVCTACVVWREGTDSTCIFCLHECVRRYVHERVVWCRSTVLLHTCMIVYLHVQCTYMLTLK